MTTEPIVGAQRIEPPSAELMLTVPHDLAYLRGHFPGAPIVAGVVQIKWAVDFGARLLGARGAFAGFEALKFQQVMMPGSVVKLSLRWAADAGKLHFAYSSDDARFGSGRVRFKAAP